MVVVAVVVVGHALSLLVKASTAVTEERVGTSRRGDRFFREIVYLNDLGQSSWAFLALNIP